MPDIVAEALGLKPQEAIDFLRRKQVTTSDHWTDVWKEAHARSFMVAGAATEALVSDFHTEVLKALENGTTLADFRKEFDAIVEKHGWEHTGSAGWRASIIYETNLSMAYSAGQYDKLSQPDSLAVFPYWQYVHTTSAHPRQQHLAWAGLTLRADDPWWDTHYPPNGWRCKCGVRPVTERGLTRMGKDGPDTAPPIVTRTWINPKDGSHHQVPVGISPGFDYNVGKAGLAAKLPADLVRPHQLEARGSAPGPRLRAEAVAAPPLKQPAATPADWMHTVLRSRREDGTAWTFPALPQPVVDALPSGAPDHVVLPARRLLHMVRDTKAVDGVALTPADQRELLRQLEHPQWVLRELQTGELVIAFPSSVPGKVARVIIAPAHTVRIDRVKRVGNVVRTATLVQEGNLDGGGYETLWDVR